MGQVRWTILQLCTWLSGPTFIRGPGSWGHNCKERVYLFSTDYLYPEIKCWLITNTHQIRRQNQNIWSFDTVCLNSRTCQYVEHYRYLALIQLALVALSCFVFFFQPIRAHFVIIAFVLYDKCSCFSQSKLSKYFFMYTTLRRISPL